MPALWLKKRTLKLNTERLDAYTKQQKAAGGTMASIRGQRELAGHIFASSLVEPVSLIVIVYEQLMQMDPANGWDPFTD
jgi:hypothetical protein